MDALMQSEQPLKWIMEKQPFFFFIPSTLPFTQVVACECCLVAVAIMTSNIPGLLHGHLMCPRSRCRDQQWPHFSFLFLLVFSPVPVPLQPISSTWYDYWGADYGTYGYNPYIGGVGIPVSKPPVAVEKPGSQSISVSVSQGRRRLD